ncbi:MAG: response regulator [Nitrospirae bacterium]|nr:MAG: response regulator [Nitrospirota bacterium]
MSHLLAVDDEPHMLLLLERIVAEKTQHRLTTTSNSLEVPRLLEQLPIDVVISDMRMPGLNGLDIVKLVNQRKTSGAVILITAFGSLDGATEAFEEGAFGYLTKPFKKELLLLTVDRALAHVASRREAKELCAVFDREPFALAREGFERLYVRRLLQRAGGDYEVAAERSGLSLDRLAILAAAG